jgi:O-antigen/teichoic acid export membrane protein
MRYGLRVQFGSWSSMANLRLDQLILALFVPFSALGLYVVAVTYAGALNLASTALSLIVLPSVAGTESIEHRHEMFRTLLTWTFWGCLGAGLILSVAAPVMVPLLFGRSFEGAVPLLPILVPASVVLGVNQMLSAGVRALGFPETASKAEMLGLVVTVIGLMALVPTQGVRGAAWTSLAAYSATTLYLMLHSRKAVGEGFWGVIMSTSAAKRAA